MYNFKKFTKTHAKTDDRISLTKSYTIGMPGHFVRQNLESKPRYTVLYFDSERLAIGMRFTDDESEEGKFSVIYSKGSHGAMIVARSFFRINDIDLNTFKGKYEWKEEQLEGIGRLFIIKLQTPDIVDSHANGGNNEEVQ